MSEAKTKQERLEEYYQSALRQVGKIGDEFRQSIYEDLRLQVEYPNEYVAYFDEWIEEGRGKKRRLVRHVLGHGTDIVAVYKTVQEPANADKDWVLLFFQDGESDTVYM
jgi:hypothetical protein